jgi:hypothetical protein
MVIHLVILNYVNKMLLYYINVNKMLLYYINNNRKNFTTLMKYCTLIF